MNHLKENPFIAILRGLQPTQAVAVVNLLYEAGLRVIEVPLNRPNALESIRLLQNNLPEDCLIGAGTVVTHEQLYSLIEMDIKLAISPNTNEGLIKKACDHKMISMPGFMSPTEAYVAYNSGARMMKLFPAASLGIVHLKAVLSILPNDVDVIAVGGVDPSNANLWLEAGAVGLGIGNSLFAQGDSYQVSKEKVMAFSKAIASK